MYNNCHGNECQEEKCCSQPVTITRSCTAQACLPSVRCMVMRSTPHVKSAILRVGSRVASEIYYSLEKLSGLGLLRVLRIKVRQRDLSGGWSALPRREENALPMLSRPNIGSTIRVYQPFLIWLALSWQARGRTFNDQLIRRRKFLLARLADEKVHKRRGSQRGGSPASRSRVDAWS
jgi:hypothetical protein